MTAVHDVQRVLVVAVVGAPCAERHIADRHPDARAVVVCLRRRTEAHPGREGGAGKKEGNAQRKCSGDAPERGVVSIDERG